MAVASASALYAAIQGHRNLNHMIAALEQEARLNEKETLSESDKEQLEAIKADWRLNDPIKWPWYW
jgi:spermidine/putrescine-binding protein